MISASAKSDVRCPVSIVALMAARAWPHPVGNIELRETHISWVLLTGEYAYKIKKPVNFGFLDFSTLDKRKHFCQEEVRLNRRLAPDIYLGVVAIGGEPDIPVVDGEGPVLEYCVRMRQFDNRQGYDELLARGELTAHHMDMTARTLADFHANIGVAKAGTAYGEPETVFAPVEENFRNIHRSLEASVVDRLAASQVVALEAWSRDAYRHLKPVFRARKDCGSIRECHGDLHLRNLLYWRDRVIPFDCLEFDPNLRWIDVMSELAFILMDLDDHGRPDLARRLANEYLEITGDFAGLQVLRYYQVYRALVRAKVAGLRFLQLGDAAGAEEEVRELSSYIELATGYSRVRQGRLLIMCGLSASGKSRVSQRLLERADLIRVRSDVERKRMFGLGAREHSDSAIERGIYSQEATVNTYARLLDLAECIVTSGYTVLVDATFLHRAQRTLFADYAARKKVPFRILQCQAPPEILRQRVIARSEKSDKVSEADLATLERQINVQESLGAAERDKCITVDTSEEPDLAGILAWLGDGAVPAGS